jgi:hypothetical protein
MTLNSDLVIFPEYRRGPPSLDAVVQVVNHLIVEGMVSVSRPFNVRIGYHRWSRSGGSLASIKETPALDTGHLLRFLNEHSTLLDRSLDLRITFKASSWLFYESVLRRLCILWDEVWPPAIHLDLVPEPTLLWDKLRAGWESPAPTATNCSTTAATACRWAGSGGPRGSRRGRSSRPAAAPTPTAWCSASNAAATMRSAT